MHIRITVTAMAWLAASAAAPAIAAGETIVTGPRNFDLLAVADAFDRAQLTKDRAALERMVDDRLIFIQSNGERAGKKAFIDGWTAPGDRFDPAKLTDRVAIWLGPDTFMVTAKATLSGISGGKRFSSSFWFTDTFRRTAGEWRVIHIQVTRASS